MYVFMHIPILQKKKKKPTHFIKPIARKRLNVYWMKNMYIGEQKYTTDALIALNPCHVDPARFARNN